MSANKNEIRPRNGHMLVVGIVARISGCANQKEQSLHDQVDHAREVTCDHYKGEVDYHVISTTGKGERLDRPELAEIENAFRSCNFDLFVIEDLGRLVRGAEATRLLGIAIDHGVRVLVPNDCIDTDDETWEQDALEACSEHVGHNSHTSRRLKKKQMNRFVKFGGATARPIYGYVVPPGAKTYTEWRKDESASPVIGEIFRRLLESPNCSAVADWLNATNVPVGPYIRQKKWIGVMVRRLVSNTLLKGVAARGYRHTVKHNETGRRISVPNPDGPKYFECPHLAFVGATEFAEVNELLNKRNAHFRRKKVNGIDPLTRVPRKRTRFPAPQAICWYCGHAFVWGGNGTTNHMMCKAARGWNCWNSFAFDGPLAARRVTDAIFAALHDIQDVQYSQFVEAAYRDGVGDLDARRHALRQRESGLAERKAKLVESLERYGPRPVIEEALEAFERDEREIAKERHALKAMSERRLHLPESPAAIENQLKAEFARLANSPGEFAVLMEKIVPEFQVHLIRLCDGGHMLPRARVKLDLGADHPDVRRVPGLSAMLVRVVTIDLFDPPQRELIRQESVRLASQGLTHKQIAARLPGKPTSTAVYKALQLDRKMKSLKLGSPYINILEPPAEYTKLRRHKNPKYHFAPLESYQKPPLI